MPSRPPFRRLLARIRGKADQVRGRWATWRALRSVEAFPTVRTRRPHGLGACLIVTLTSYPPRYPSLALTLRSLLDQTVPADRVILWVDAENMPPLPENVLALRDAGLEIREAEGLRSYNKLVPALRAFPDAVLVTADDDVYYPPDWLAQLTALAAAEPGAVLAHRCHMAVADEDGRLRPYKDWELLTAETRSRSPRELLFPTGVGGILYPPGSLAPEVLDTALFTELCPSADDVWFFWMARRAGAVHRRVASSWRILSWPRSQEVALFHSNKHGNGNDQAIRRIEGTLGPVK
jgi:hypothetical protein